MKGRLSSEQNRIQSRETPWRVSVWCTHRIYPFILIIVVFLSCTDSRDTVKKNQNPAALKEPLIKINKITTEDKSTEIERYIERHGLNMETSGTGLRFSILCVAQGKKPENGNFVKIRYSVSLLNGQLCYEGTKEFTLGFSDIESGLTEGILLLHQGDKSKFILPPHLAHGVSGDNDCIPPNAVIMYDVELLEVIESKKYTDAE
ncbi:MAG: FKBP-type peptidyl-prolyl cis-trans isomerase [Bacteroidetes bacterium]|nr:FKBP-type peptidyl-prolyl cis-trans isomerase [Bacteroidota bacterium]